VGFVEGETGYCSETCVTCGVGGTGDGSIKLEEAIDVKEEVSIKVEDNIDIKDEIPQFNNEHEVRLWGDVCWGQLPSSPAKFHTSRRPCVCLAIPALIALLGSLTDSLTVTGGCAYANCKMFGFRTVMLSHVNSLG
jgi:hypothetical protein